MPARRGDYMQVDVLLVVKSEDNAQRSQLTLHEPNILRKDTCYAAATTRRNVYGNVTVEIHCVLKND